MRIMLSSSARKAIHINIRQSIVFLAGKLAAVQIFFGAISLFLFFPLPFFKLVVIHSPQFTSIETLIFLLLLGSQVIFSLFLTLQWLYNYYEILPDKVIYRKGFFFRKEQHYIYAYVREIGLIQGFLGKLFNYGTILMYDRFLRRSNYLYLIHNPLKYFHIIERLVPPSDEIQQKIREKLSEEEEGDFDQEHLIFEKNQIGV